MGSRPGAGLLASGSTPRAFPRTPWRPQWLHRTRRVRRASPVTVAGPHRTLTGLPRPTGRCLCCAAILYPAAGARGRARVATARRPERRQRRWASGRPAGTLRRKRPIPWSSDDHRRGRCRFGTGRRRLRTAATKAASTPRAPFAGSVLSGGRLTTTDKDGAGREPEPRASRNGSRLFRCCRSRRRSHARLAAGLASFVAAVRAAGALECRRPSPTRRGREVPGRQAPRDIFGGA